VVRPRHRRGLAVFPSKDGSHIHFALSALTIKLTVLFCAICGLFAIVGVINAIYGEQNVLLFWTL
jgi:hypothetical protein